MDSLNKVVQLCDIDQDGYLDLSEFICAAHISYVCRDVFSYCCSYLQGRPLPEEIPDCLLDPEKKEYLEKEKEEKKVDENPFGDPSGDPFATGFDISDNSFSKVVGKVLLSFSPDVQSNPFLSDEEEIESPVTEEVEDRNPFSKGLKEALEAEQQALEALKDPMNVPAIVCDNREKIRSAWIDNMTKWKDLQEELQEKLDEIERKKQENDSMREKITEAQEKLQEIQVYVQGRCNGLLWIIRNSEEDCHSTSSIE